VHGMMIQLRMPEGDLNNHEQEILDEIAPEKDVDGLHSLNQENPMREGGFMAATVKGTFYLFESESIDVQGKNVVCIGRTNLFGKPFAKACDAKGASCVALLGRDWKEHMDKLKEADIIVGAVGEGKILVEPDMVKESVVLIDVGLGPDINWKAMIEAGKSGYTTKRWGGTGPVTVYSIVENCVLAAERRLVAIF
jgi:5,10-methylene-tetrahydrofolate dehydrogenase/methenyl tetrahydrofolate cyclohydrolase